jgi:hypothetical protein
MTLAQAYSALYYEEKVKDFVPDRWKVERQRIIESKEKDYGETAPVWFCNSIAKELYEDETAEVKEKVERHREQVLAGKINDEVMEVDDGADDVDEEEKSRRLRAQSYQE